MVLLSATKFATFLCLSLALGVSAKVRGSRPPHGIVNVTADETFNLLDLPCSRQHPESPNLVLKSQFWSPAEVLEIRNKLKLPKKQIEDRTDDLVFAHDVWRIEDELKKNHPTVLRKMETLLYGAVDFWNVTKKAAVPRRYEIEYISYEVKDVKNKTALPHFEDHVDNESLITMVSMLSAPDEYDGGLLTLEDDDIKACREGITGKGGRAADNSVFQSGDVVMFRGEETLHGVSHITRGARYVMQVEFALDDGKDDSDSPDKDSDHDGGAIDEDEEDDGDEEDKAEGKDEL